MNGSSLPAPRKIVGLLAVICFMVHGAVYVNFSNAAQSREQTSVEQHSGDDPDIEWFKDEMKISDKYAERQEGIMGVSWAHFFTMILLALFAGGALVGIVIRYIRTRQLIEEIRKE
ncbi:MAG: hypothetical protein ACOC8I_04010 [Desulfosalsimonas sp.]